MDSKPKGKTLRLIMPEWQGGDYDTTPPTAYMYPLGSYLLAFLAPHTNNPTVEIPIEPYFKAERPVENQVVWQSTVLNNYRRAKSIIEAHAPDRIVVFGGECLVSQAPFAYLNEKYHGKLGIIWIDAHPDISTPKMHSREHAMVLGNLLGHGDPVLAKEIKIPVKTENVLLVGVDQVLEAEAKVMQDLNLARIRPSQLINNNQYDNQAVLNWIKQQELEYLAIHFDLDSLSPKLFYSQLLNAPGMEPFDTFAGQLTIQQVTGLIAEISNIADVVGLVFAEHIPWDAYNLRNMMEQLPIMQ